MYWGMHNRVHSVVFIIILNHLYRQSNKISVWSRCSFVPSTILFDVFFLFLYYFEVIYNQCPYSHVCTYTFCGVYLININQSINRDRFSVSKNDITPYKKTTMQNV